MISRRSLLRGVSLMTAGTALSATAGSARAGIFPAVNEIIVGPGCDFEQVANALASIVDNSESNPYLIHVMPGAYDLQWSAKSWVSVIGSGPLATLFVGADGNGITVTQPNLLLGNFGIRFAGSAEEHAAISGFRKPFGIYLENIHIEQTGRGSAIRTRSQKSLQSLKTWWLKDLFIRTENIGLDLGGHMYCDDLKVVMHGTNSGYAHVGCRVEQRSRIYMQGCRIGTGYWFGHTGTDYVLNNVYGLDDVIGIWLPPDAEKARVEVHNLESFCRNNNYSPPDVIVNVIRTENGWVRAFGCFGQAESLRPGKTKSLHQSGDGIIEQFASRFSRIDGESFGAQTLGVQTLTSADDGLRMFKFEGGLHRLDATQGDFTITLPPAGDAMPGVVHVFKKINVGNTVFIDLFGQTCEGMPGPLLLTQQYETLKITWDSQEWIRV